MQRRAKYVPLFRFSVFTDTQGISQPALSGQVSVAGAPEVPCPIPFLFWTPRSPGSVKCICSGSSPADRILIYSFDRRPPHPQDEDGRDEGHTGCAVDNLRGACFLLENVPPTDSLRTHICTIFLPQSEKQVHATQA